LDASWRERKGMRGFFACRQAGRVHRDEGMVKPGSRSDDFFALASGHMAMNRRLDPVSPPAMLAQGFVWRTSWDEREPLATLCSSGSNPDRSTR